MSSRLTGAHKIFLRCVPEAHSNVTSGNENGIPTFHYKKSNSPGNRLEVTVVVKNIEASWNPEKRFQLTWAKNSESF